MRFFPAPAKLVDVQQTVHLGRQSSAAEAAVGKLLEDGAGSGVGVPQLLPRRENPAGRLIQRQRIDLHGAFHFHGCNGQVAVPFFRVGRIRIVKFIQIAQADFVAAFNESYPRFNRLRRVRVLHRYVGPAHHFIDRQQFHFGVFAARRLSPNFGPDQIFAADRRGVFRIAQPVESHQPRAVRGKTLTGQRVPRKNGYNRIGRGRRYGGV